MFVDAADSIPAHEAANHRAKFGLFGWPPLSDVGAWQRTLGPRSRLCLHWIAWLQKPTLIIKQQVASCHTAAVISIQSLPAPPHTPRGQPISEVGGGLPPFLAWTSSPSHRLTHCFRVPDFPHIREWRGSKCRFWVLKSSKLGFFAPQICWGARMDNGHTTLCGTVSRNRPRDVEKSVDGKTKKLECGPMRNVMAALPNMAPSVQTSTPQSLAQDSDAKWILYLAKFRYWARTAENVLVHQPSRRQTSCKVWLASVERRRCSNEAKTRNPLKFAGVLQARQPISAASGPKFTILWGHVGKILLFNQFFSDCRYMPYFAKI